jgi:hypothetical protein
MLALVFIYIELIRTTFLALLYSPPVYDCCDSTSIYSLVLDNVDLGRSGFVSSDMSDIFIEIQVAFLLLIRVFGSF